MKKTGRMVVSSICASFAAKVFHAVALLMTFGAREILRETGSARRRL